MRRAPAPAAPKNWPPPRRNERPPHASAPEGVKSGRPKRRTASSTLGTHSLRAEGKHGTSAEGASPKKDCTTA
eukprot:1553509-Lingulodinium_polyedra.AAC.1